MGTARPRTAAVLPRTVIVLGGVSLLNDAASEMITPLLPVFLTATLGAGIYVSAGGHLACLAATLAQPDTRVQAVLGFAPPTDMVADNERRNGLSNARKIPPRMARA